MKYLVNLEDGTEVRYNDDDEPIVKTCTEYEEMLLFRGGSTEELVVAFCAVPYISELGHEADAVCSGCMRHHIA